MKILIVLFAFFVFVFGKKPDVKKGDVDNTRFTFTDNGPSGKGDTTIIFGNISEVNCLFKLYNTRVSYGKRKYTMYHKTTGCPTTIADSVGNYRIELDSISVLKTMGLSFNFRSGDTYADYFIVVPQQYRGHLVELKAEVVSKSSGLNCY